MARVVEYGAGMGTFALALRTDAGCLVAASAAAFIMDAFGVPIAGIGFVDAHELALFAGLLLWTASPRPCWNLAAAAVHVLFAAANLAHWESFVSADIVTAGYVTTAAHVLFAGRGCVAARTATASSPLAGEPEAVRA